MDLNDEELEKQLIEAGNKIISPPSITELISSLDRVESLLTRVEQSPSQSIRKALSPLMKSLIANDLLRHSDIDVKVSVAACISEITRITAPDAPYEDEQMKEVFQLIVSSFENLDDTSSQSYIKRTSILETVAKVRSCVVMLDLECDALIAEMFEIFFRSVRSQHPENVFSSMETIMTLVLEESEDVPVDLVSSILNVLKTENKEVLPIARQLGEKVFEKCVSKIEPCLEQAMKSLHTTQDDYLNIVVNVLKSKSEAIETKDADAASKNVTLNQADENDVADKPKEKEVEVALETLDDAPPSEEVGPTTVVSPKSPVSNGAIQKEMEDTSVGSANAEEAVKEANSEPHGEGEETGKSKVQNSVAEELTNSRSKPEKANKRKGKKTKTSKSSSEPSEPVLVDEKEVVEKSEPHGKDTEKDGNAQNEDPVVDTAEPAENEKEAEERVPSPKTSDEPVDVPSPSPNGSIADENASKKVESEEKKDERVEHVPAGDIELKESDTNKSDEEAVVSEPKLHEKVPSTTDKEDSAPSSVDVSKKELEKASELDAKSAKQSGKKVLVGSQSEDRKKRGQGKATTTKNPAKSSSKDESKKSGSSVKSAAKPAKDEIGSSVKSAAKPAKDGSGADKGSKANTKRKHSSENKEHKFGEELVGSKVQVWWPDDKKFYAGVIEHFDPSIGKHKVTYSDGDVEVLKLEKERWKLADGSLSHDPGHSSDGDNPDETAEMPKAKKAKTSPAVGSKQRKTESSAKKGGASSSKSKATSKSQSKQTEEKRSGGKTEDTLKSLGKSEENKGGKSKDSKAGNNTPKSGGKSKDNEVEPSKGSSKSKQETPKGVSKSKAKSPKVGSSKAKAAPSPKEEEDEEMESSPEPVKALGNSKGKSGSKSQKSAKKRKRGTKG